jgi:hypothetical protein
MPKTIKFLLLFLISGCLTVNQLNRVSAQADQTPKEILEIVNQLDLASSSGDVQLLKKYISPQFVNEDGLTYETLHKSLEQIWSKYQDLQYTSQVESWRRDNNQLVAIVVTNIQGYYEINGQKFALNSEIKSEQFFVDNQLIKQNILSEKNEVTSGDKPPTVNVKLPEKARPGEEFSLDVILEEPIGSDLVLGAAIEEKIDSSLYLKPANLELEALTAGGIFKKVRLPLTAKDHWYSFILIRDGGLRMITQRVNVES